MGDVVEEAAGKERERVREVEVTRHRQQVGATKLFLVMGQPEGRPSSPGSTKLRSVYCVDEVCRSLKS